MGSFRVPADIVVREVDDTVRGEDASSGCWDDRGIWSVDLVVPPDVM